MNSIYIPPMRDLNRNYAEIQQRRLARLRRLTIVKDVLQLLLVAVLIFGSNYIGLTLLAERLMP